MTEPSQVQVGWQHEDGFICDMNTAHCFDDGNGGTVEVPCAEVDAVVPVYRLSGPAAGLREGRQQ